MDEKQKPESMDGIFSLENLEFLAQYKIRTRILSVLKEHFEVREVLLIKSKEEPKP